MSESGRADLRLKPNSSLRQYLTSNFDVLALTLDLIDAHLYAFRSQGVITEGECAKLRVINNQSNELQRNKAFIELLCEDELRFGSNEQLRSIIDILKDKNMQRPEAAVILEEYADKYNSFEKWRNYVSQHSHELIYNLNLTDNLLLNFRANKFVNASEYGRLVADLVYHRNIEFVEILREFPDRFTSKQSLDLAVRLLNDRNHPRRECAAIFKKFSEAHYPTQVENKAEPKTSKDSDATTDSSRSVLKLSGKSQALFLATCLAAHLEKFPNEDLLKNPEDFFNKLFHPSEPVFVELNYATCAEVKAYIQQHTAQDESKLQCSTTAAVVPEKAKDPTTGIDGQEVLSSIIVAAAKICVFLNPNPVSLPLITQTCLKLPAIQKWRTKNDKKFAILQPVTSVLVKDAITWLLKAERLTEKDDNYQLNDKYRIQPEDMRNPETFLQWFLYEYAALIDRAEALAALPFLLDNLLPFVSNDSVRKFFFHIHETRVNVPVTSVYLYLLSQKLQVDEVVVWNQPGVVKKLSPTFSRFKPGKDSIDDLYKLAAANAETCRNATQRGLPTDIIHFNFSVDELKDTFVDQTKVFSEIDFKLLSQREEEPGRPPVIVIYGLPGSGKTTLLKKYILEKVLDANAPLSTTATIKRIIWLDAKSEDVLESQLRQMCHSVLDDSTETEYQFRLEDEFITESSSTQPGETGSSTETTYSKDSGKSGAGQQNLRNRINALYNRLLSEPSVIVLDDASSSGHPTLCAPSDFIPESFSSATAPIVFITTQNANNWLHLKSCGVEFLCLPSLQAEAAVQYISDRLGTNDTDSAQDTELANYLDYFPLALKIACDVIHETNASGIGSSKQQQVYTSATLLSDMKAMPSQWSTPGTTFFHTLQREWANLNTLVQHDDSKAGLAVLDILAMMGSPVPSSWIHEELQLRRQDRRYFQQLLQYLQFCSLLVIESDRRLRIPNLLRMIKLQQLSENSEKREQSFDVAIRILTKKASANVKLVKSIGLNMITSLRQFQSDVTPHIRKIVHLQAQFRLEEDRVQYLRAIADKLEHDNHRMEPTLKDEISQLIYVDRSSNSRVGVITVGDINIQSSNIYIDRSFNNYIQEKKYYYNYPTFEAQRLNLNPALLGELNQLLEANEKTVVLAGIGGVGKTCLVQAFIERAADFINVIFLNAQNKDTLNRQMDKVLTELQLNAKNHDENMFNFFFKLHHRKSIVVLDDACNEDTLETFLSYGSSSSMIESKLHIIITTRNVRGWPNPKAVLEISKLTKDQSKFFIQNRLSTLKIPVADIDADWEILAKQEEYNAFQLDKAFEKILQHSHQFKESQTGLYTFSDYLKYYESLLFLWLKTMYKVSAKNPRTMDFLKLVSLMPPDGCSRQFLEAVLLGRNNSNSDSVKSTICMLRNRSLLQVDGEYCSIHRILRTEILKRLEYTEEFGALINWLLPAIEALNPEDAIQTSETRRYVDSIISHLNPLVTELHVIKFLYYARKVGAHKQEKLLNRLARDTAYQLITVSQEALELLCMDERLLKYNLMKLFAAQVKDEQPLKLLQFISDHAWPASRQLPSFYNFEDYRLVEHSLTVLELVTRILPQLVEEGRTDFATVTKIFSKLSWPVSTGSFSEIDQELHHKFENTILKFGHLLISVLDQHHAKINTNSSSIAHKLLLFCMCWPRFNILNSSKISMISQKLAITLDSLPLDGNAKIYQDIICELDPSSSDTKHGHEILAKIISAICQLSLKDQPNKFRLLEKSVQFSAAATVLRSQPALLMYIAIVAANIRAFESQLWQRISRPDAKDSSILDFNNLFSLDVMKSISHMKTLPNIDRVTSFFEMMESFETQNILYSSASNAQNLNQQRYNTENYVSYVSKAVGFLKKDLSSGDQVLELYRFAVTESYKEHTATTARGLFECRCIHTELELKLAQFCLEHHNEVNEEERKRRRHIEDAILFAERALFHRLSCKRRWDWSELVDILSKAYSYSPLAAGKRMSGIIKELLKLDQSEENEAPTNCKWNLRSQVLMYLIQIGDLGAASSLLKKWSEAYSKDSQDWSDELSMFVDVAKGFLVSLIIRQQLDQALHATSVLIRALESTRNPPSAMEYQVESIRSLECVLNLKLKQPGALAKLQRSVEAISGALAEPTTYQLLETLWFKLLLTTYELREQQISQDDDQEKPSFREWIEKHDKSAILVKEKATVLYFTVLFNLFTETVKRPGLKREVTELYVIPKNSMFQCSDIFGVEGRIKSLEKEISNLRLQNT